jgi:hypothetical protein
LGRLVADGVLVGDAVQLLGGVLDGVDRCLERPSLRCIACATSRHLSHWPPGVTARLPLSAGLTVTQVTRAPLRLRAYLTGPSMRRGLDM